MKTIKYITLALIGIFFLAVSCKDDKELVPVWESAVNGQGLITSSLKDLRIGSPEIPMDFSLKWVSIDGKLDVTKMDVYLSFTENYTDADKNPAVASHGEVLWATYEGGSVPANRAPVAFSITQDDLYQAYQSATFDYGDGAGPVNIFATPVNATFREQGRDTTRLTSADKFKIRWVFTTSDGRTFGKFADGTGWSPSACTELPGSNCQIAFGVGCATVIEKPAGAWKIDMVDTYGDGWQGGYISVKIDGVETKVFIPNQYTPPPGGSGGVAIGALTTIVNVPASATTLTFNWQGPESYPSEVQFTITSPSGNVVASVNNPGATTAPAHTAPIKLNLCKEK